jgi:glycerol uptake facilitator-like aquaporin
MAMVTLVLISNSEKHYQINTTHLGLFAGFLVYIFLEAYGPISAQMNPMASFCLFLAGKISLARALIYIVLQTLASAAGSGIGYCLTPAAKFTPSTGPFHAFNPAVNGLTNVQGVFIEAIFAFNLMFVVLSCHDATLFRPFPYLPNLAIGLAIGIGIITAGTHTGGLMNPIIAFGPALLALDFTNHWVYWVGPFVGGPPAVIVYKLFICIKANFDQPPKKEEENNPPQYESGL